MSLSEEQRAEVAPKVERMVKYWLMKCPSQVDPDDALSAAWEGICRAADRYDPDHPKQASFATYALIVARGSMIDWFRDTHQISRKESLLSLSVEWDDHLHGSVEPNLHGTILTEHMIVRLQDMPQRTQSMFMLRFWHDQSYREIGEAHGVSETRVQQVMHTAFLRLRKPNYELGGHRHVR